MVMNLRREHLTHHGAGHATHQPPHRAPASILDHPSLAEAFGGLSDGSMDALMIPPPEAHKSPLTEADVMAPSPYHGPAARLRAFHHNHPFVPIFPMPQYVTSVYMANPSAPFDIRLHDNAIACMFTATPSVVCYANFNGRATNAASPSFDPNTMVDPTGFLMYCLGRQMVSVIIDGTGVVSCYQYVQESLAGEHP